MKKFIQSKIKRLENIPNPDVEKTTPIIATKKRKPLASNIQPPLPLEPPPPLIPWIQVKLEPKTEDTEYIGEFKSEPEQDDVKPPATISPDSISGACSLAHDSSPPNRLLTQSTYKCAHANIVERQNFYCTGHVPPGAVIHSLPPPLPPPPPPPKQLLQLLPPPNFIFDKPPPKLPHNYLKAGMPSNPMLDMPSNPLKRTWSVLDNSHYQHSEYCASFPTKYDKDCLKCYLAELTVLHYDTEIQAFMSHCENKVMTIDKLEKKNKKLKMFLMKLLQSKMSKSLPSLDNQYIW